MAIHKKMRGSMTMKMILLVICLSLLTGCVTSVDFDSVVRGNASVEYGCAKESIKILRQTEYMGGGAFAIDACGNKATYECMGTVCQKACSYTPQPSGFSGTPETDGAFHSVVMKRAGVDFECTDIKQMSHSDSRGQGVYMLDVCGNKAKYQCAGSVCNLACN